MRKKVCEVIISLTSYPARIEKVSHVLDSIMKQTYKPKAIVLYLSLDQFPEKMLPVDLSVYFEQGLEIHWYPDDMKSHKKYLYAFQEYPDDYIITIDDDFYYEKHMIEELVNYTDDFPKCVLARRTHLITAECNGSISQYESWWGECIHYIGEPRMDLLAVGCSGILYPPHLLTKEVFHIDYIKKYCMYADDIWLKVMELISGIPVVQVPTRFLDRFDAEFAQDGLYQQHNGNGGNDRILRLLLEKYDYFDCMNESLIERIFLTGIVYENKITEGKKRDNIRLWEECIASIGKDIDIVIYGAGIVAKRVSNALKKYAMNDKIRTFVVEDIDRNVSGIDNVKVIQYKKANYEDSVCIIAVSDLAQQYQISQKLMLLGVQEFQIRFLNKWVLAALRDI